MNLYAMQPTVGGPGSCCLHETDDEALECAAIKGAQDVIESHKTLEEWAYAIDGDMDVFRVGEVTKVGATKALDAPDTREKVAEIFVENNRVGRLHLVRGE